MSKLKELFRDGDWILGRMERKEDEWTAMPGQVWDYSPKGSGDTFISHTTCGGAGYVRFWVTTSCPRCRKAAPAAMLGMRDLVEWDR